MASTQPAGVATVIGDEDEQVTVRTLEPGGSILRFLGLTALFTKAVAVPKKGEELKNIKLQVPYTTSFVKAEKKARAALRKTNLTRTAKYSPITFLPIAVTLQFRRFANLFYLLITTLSIIGWFYPTLFLVPTTPVPLIFLVAGIVLFSLIFEGFDDFNRHRGDHKTNNSKALRIRKNKVVETTWGELIPGDLVFVKDRSYVPADMLVVATFGADKKGSTCYIETSSIDGETNLKIRESPAYMTNAINSIPQTKRVLGASHKRNSGVDSKEVYAKYIPDMVKGVYEYEQPNVFLQFNGTYSPACLDIPTQPLGFQNFVLRGSQVRNTKWVLGIVMYAGEETKLALSNEKSPAKLGRIDHFMNKALFAVFVLYLILCVVADIWLFEGTPDTVGWWYFKYTSSKHAFQMPGPIAYFFTFMIPFMNIIPISILIIVEILSAWAKFIVNNDIEMYHEATDTRAKCRTSNLVAEVGQITHVFSDKTGTLTQNRMKMVGCLVDGQTYGFVPPVEGDVSDQDSEETPEESVDVPEVVIEASVRIDEKVHCGADEGESPGNDGNQTPSSSLSAEEVFQDVNAILNTPGQSREKQALLDYFILLAVCHTVVLEDTDEGGIQLNSESPDEEAFVNAARLVGVKLVSTSEGTIGISTPVGDYEYLILGLNPFNSSRKRMSIVVQRTCDDSIALLMKGADNVMFDRLAPGQEGQVAEMKTMLDRYSWAGLRTLVMAKKDLSEEEFMIWEQEYKNALLSPPSTRGAEIASVARKIEKNVVLCGASAIEDELQAGVPEAIRTLRGAGTQVWVLTGDKVETAINIGLSSNLLDASMLQVKLVSHDVVHLEDQIDGVISILETAIETVDKSKARQDDLIFGEEPPHTKTAMPTCFEDLHRFFHQRVLRKYENEDFQANVALVVSGESLELLLRKQKGSKELEAKLLKLARYCKVVLACRVSPAQKSLMIEMVRYAPDVKKLKRPPVTLAIGDGANDVPMIQAAHVGIGLSGNEGQQAVNCSDFSIAQFRFLVRLMLVHGRWNYRRIANVVSFVMYSFQLLTFLLFMYLPYSLCSGQYIFYHAFFISVVPYMGNFAVLAAGFFDRDISASTVLENPWTYAIGVKSDDLNYQKLFTQLLRASVHTVIIWGFVMAISNPDIPLESLGTGMFLAFMMVLLFVQMTRVFTVTSVTILVYFINFFVYFMFMGFIYPPSVIFDGKYASSIWVGVFLACCTIVLIEMVVRYVKMEFFPRPLDLLMEQDRGYHKGEKYTRRAHKDALKVLGEFGKMSVQPLNLGAKRIKRATRMQTVGERTSVKLDPPPVVIDTEYSSGESDSDDNVPPKRTRRKTPLKQLSSKFTLLQANLNFSSIKNVFMSHKAQNAGDGLAERGEGLLECDDDLLLSTGTSRIGMVNYVPRGSTLRKSLKTVGEDDSLSGSAHNIHTSSGPGVHEAFV
mmetsp:Transcript_15935/g.26026  ORF Transcript_15935/g.26026 Transcript_15935/m.26026 type:complete len:1436 (+) Transcript_15935:194-4501(+)|eukprot:CAMPEP_0203757888 /NCGR_PEP_ID=MMETSP0098-20131031/10742_1 /ASSEMBLY_ACC=CAM_ASM_000208 /TAXON_ID=96639 /ORGANISM=" , Strain NY0313808BC1" /LENGTH=1435 /DNA_ID=CAMNT_0050650133 /DNA_START=248 /DNA_END=4555 /DNA_ORIENTATION=-